MKIHIAWVAVITVVMFFIGSFWGIHLRITNEPEYSYKEIQMTGDTTEIMMNGKKYKQPAMIYVEGLTEVWTRHLVSTKGKDSSILFTLVKK